MSNFAALKVLLVDDFDSVADSLNAILKNIGIINTSRASNGKEAMEIFTEAASGTKAFDLILLDVNMPIMSGIEFLKEVRELDIGKVVKIIMVTTESEQDLVLDCLLSGASDFIIKPFDDEIVHKKIQKLFS